MEVQEKSRRGLRPAGFSVNWLLCELTRRAGLLWLWRGGRRGSNGGRFGGDSSLTGLRLSEQWRGRGAAAWQAAGPALACRAGKPAGQARPEERELGGGAGLQVAACRVTRGRRGPRGGLGLEAEGRRGRWEKEKKGKRKGEKGKENEEKKKGK
jgi:hypothetical protein